MRETKPRFYLNLHISINGKRTMSQEIYSIDSCLNIERPQYYHARGFTEMDQFPLSQLSSSEVIKKKALIYPHEYKQEH